MPITKERYIEVKKLMRAHTNQFEQSLSDEDSSIQIPKPHIPSVLLGIGIGMGLSAEEVRAVYLRGEEGTVA